MNQEPRNLDIKGEILPEGVENQVEVVFDQLRTPVQLPAVAVTTF